MKKILLLSLALCAMASVQAQNLDAYYRYTVSDTITDAEADTIELPVLMLSPWSYNWTIQTTQLSGTQALAVALQESSSINGTDWFPVDSKSTTGAADLDRITGQLIYGQRQRIIITGTGTQSTKYSIYFIAKKVFR